MNYKNRFLAIVLLIWTILLPGCSYSQMTVVSDIEEVFDGINRVEIYGGPLEVTYEGRNNTSEVSLNAYLEANKPDGVSIEYKVEGDKLIVKWEQSKGFSGWGSFNTEGFISLIGPKDVSLKVDSGSGKASVSGVRNEEIDLSAGSGSVAASDLEVQQMHLSVSSGKLEGKDLVGNVNCKVSSGAAYLKGVEGNVDVVASSGKISVEDASGLVNAKITSGKIELANIGELGSLAGSSGKIEVNNAGLGDNTNIKFSSGSIEIQTPDDLSSFNFNLAASSGSVRVGDQKSGDALIINNNAAKTVSGAVSSGSIRIHN